MLYTAEAPSALRVERGSAPRKKPSAVKKTESAMATCLILGLGNSLMSDDGLGVRAVERLLEDYVLPAEVAVREGGTLGLHLLPDLEGVRDLLIIDAIRADEPPGTLIRLEGAAIPARLAPKLSLHQVGLDELLAVSGVLGHQPKRVVLWGMPPAVLTLGLALTPRVAAQLEALVERIVAELHTWGFSLVRVGG
jgi:hydrogenase maturation protease